ncbi:MAG TPA: recombination mediator RecR [Ignavibacteriales bacterium]|nr:recombination mediator RecR [Ignavibacteriales bacterium]HOL80569.1 recombination mediator RecR [Ignavibacteriales bacterium]HOM64259.1 recombination mediator RecR [Ignavibacteriales bacterium]HPD68560.1 recombination mediator RecR [Ignavibacteriales bacterium]HPP33095.1 recombination mediator RecR [Ignavibacteriales bacterium]
MLIVKPLEKLIDEFSKLPGIGKKTAQRLALYIINNDISYTQELAQALIDIKTQTKLCKKCFNLSEDDLCPVCSNVKRVQSIICVVENISDLIAIEKSEYFNGVYHVLGGVLSPIKGIGANDLKIKELIHRIENDNIEEVILALNPTTEGETTILYLADLLKKYNLKITRIAKGLSVGMSLEFADSATISSAVNLRTELK